MKHWILALVVLLVSFFATPAKAEIINWRLEFTHTEPRAIHVKFGDNRVVYHYVLYTVENKNEIDVDVDLLFFGATDSGKDFTDVLDPVAERAILIREARLDLADSVDEGIAQLKAAKRFLNRTEMLEEKMPAGAKWEGVAIFTEIDPNMDRMILQVSGLASYVRQVKGQISTVIEVYRAYYERKGDEFNRDNDPFEHIYYMDKWVEVKEFGQLREDKDGNPETWVQRKLQRR